MTSTAEYVPNAAPAVPPSSTGKERDTESGNEHFPARYYASNMGRFITPDPYEGSYDINDQPILRLSSRSDGIMAILTIHRISNYWLTVLCVAALLVLNYGADAATVDGFVTKLYSPTRFDLGTLQVTISGKTECLEETWSSDVTSKDKTYDGILAHSYITFQSHLVPASRLPKPCPQLLLKIGSHLHIVGAITSAGGSVVAARVTAVDAGIEQHSEGGALLEEVPHVDRTDLGWTGVFWLDGYPVSITADTKLLSAPSGTQIGYKAGTFAAPRMRAILSGSPAPAISDSLFRPNTWATYRGNDVVDGCIPLYRLRLWPNGVGRKEKDYWTRLAPVVREPDYLNRVAGLIRFPHARAGELFEIVPNQPVQKFVSSLGAALIPQYQMSMADSESSKIHFRFYVVRSLGAALDDEAHKVDGLSSLLRPRPFNAPVALPDGLIVVPDQMLARIENRAQLASLLSYAVTSVLQKDSFIRRFADPYPTFDEFSSEFLPFDLDLPMTKQALRIGTRQMYLAGHDIREAPFAWALAEGSPVENPLIDSNDPRNDFTWFAATYVFGYISKYYADVDYSKLKTGEAEYAQFLEELRKADPEAFQKK